MPGLWVFIPAPSVHHFSYNSDFIALGIADSVGGAAGLFWVCCSDQLHSQPITDALVLGAGISNVVNTAERMRAWVL